jgi:hypothetical protein
MKRLFLLSYGLRPEQLTAETAVLLRRCGAVFTRALDKVSAARLPGGCPNLVLLEGAGTREAERAVLAAFEMHEEVGYLTYGHPLLRNGNLQRLAGLAERRGVAVAVLDAVSSFDALLSLFGLTVETELRVVNASNFGPGVKLSPEADTFFYSADLLNSPGEAARKSAFLAAAAKAYPPRAAVFVASCYSGVEGFRVRKGAVAGLPRLLAGTGRQDTLFIPGREWRREGFPRRRKF